MRSIVYALRGGSRIWHVARRDGHTVCGMRIDPADVVVAASDNGDPRDTCKSCLRMKDADTANVARSLSEARG